MKSTFVHSSVFAALFRGFIFGDKVPALKAAPKGRPGVPANIQHFNWNAHREYGGPRAAWSYRGARRNAMKGVRA